MRTILPKAPLCFFSTALLGNAANGGFEYLALGKPDLSRVFPKTKDVDWDAFERLGSVAALRIDQDTYLEVRSFRGAYFGLDSRQTGERKTWAAGSFLFPAHKPMVLGAFKCYREMDWYGEDVAMRRHSMSIASVGKKGILSSYASERRACGIANSAARIPFLSCIAMAYLKGMGDDGDELSTVLKSIKGVARQSSWGARNLFREIFGSGNKPVRFEGQIQFYVPDALTDDYSDAVPLKRPEAITARDTYVGYDLRRSRFVSIDR